MKRFDPIEAMATARHEFGEHGGVNMSIETSTTFTVMKAETMPSIFHGRQGPHEGCYLYGRHFNPTVYALGQQMAAMEGTEAAYCASSGMAAISSTFLQLCDQGDHAVVAKAVYGGTFALLKNVLPRKCGLGVTFVDVTDLAEVENAFTERTKLVYVETMSNPTMVVPDIPKLARIAHDRGAKLVVDNTFCPLVVSPAQHGADIVIHSLTKFVNGASDVIGGTICADEAFIQSMMNTDDGALMLFGPTMDPNVAFSVSMRLPHLGIRMAEHSRRAQLFAERLHALGVEVVYPGLPSHPQHFLLERMANPGFGYGGLFCMDLGTQERAFEFMGILQNKDNFGFIAVSLGYFETLVSCSGSSTSSELSEEEQRRAGISPGLVRISMGYTGSVEQRWEQLEDALRTVGMIKASASK